MSNRIYEIVEEIATLSGTGRSKRKVRRIRWDNSPDSVLDIRKWFQEVDGTETPCKGIKLDAAEEAPCGKLFVCKRKTRKERSS